MTSVWYGKDFAARWKTVGSAERKEIGTKISTRRVSSNTPSLYIEAQRPLGQIFMDVGITESKMRRRYCGKSDLYYG